MSNRAIWTIVVIAIIVIVGGYYLYSRSQQGSSSAPESQEYGSGQTPSSEGNAASGGNQGVSSGTNERTVEMTAQGFSPSSLAIPVGTTVHFINKDTKPHWPASGMHPTHLVCKGFDALHGVNPGDSYSYTFNAAKTCPMHDHLNPSLHGTIIVQ